MTLPPCSYQVTHFHGAFLGIPVMAPNQEREEVSGSLEEGGWAQGGERKPMQSPPHKP